jgi:hypothetical protein
MLKRIAGELLILLFVIELSYFLLLFLAGFSFEIRIGFIGFLLIAFSVIIRRFR